MTFLDVFKAIFLGFAVAAPVGPISMLCIRTTLSSGFSAGFSAGLGAALADGLVSLAALGGLAAVLSSSVISVSLLSYCAAAFLFYLGVKMLLKSNETLFATSQVKQNAHMSFISTFALTVINPLTLMSFAALFCTVNSSQRSFLELFGTAACIALGSALWWLCLAVFLSVARRSIGPRSMKSINIGSALCILGCGVKLLLP